MKRVVIIGKNTIQQQYVEKLIAEHDCLFYMGTYGADENIEGIIKRTAADYVIVDLFSKDFSESLLARISETKADVSVILMTSRIYPNLRYYVHRYKVINMIFVEDELESVEKVIAKLGNGNPEGNWLNSKESLTTREQEILKYIALGKTSKEIGEMLSISKNTVDTHRNKILKKLNISNSAALITYAYKAGMLPNGMHDEYIM